MLLCETDTTNATADASTGFRVRLRGADIGERVSTIPQGRTTIGSSPRCNVRIEQPGVHPLHCLIVYAANKLSVRRWAADTKLNGQPFDEAPLTPGDCLSIGPVELVIESVEPAVQPATEPIDVVEHRDRNDEEPREHGHEQLQNHFEAPPEVYTDRHADEPPQEKPCQDASQESCDVGHDAVREFAAASDHGSVWLNDDQRTPWIDDPDFGGEPLPTELAERESYRWKASVSRTVVPFEAAKIVFRELQTATAISRGRSRKLLAALRQNRDEYARLAERVEGLECLMQAALFEQEGLRLLADERPEAGVESTILTRSRGMAADAVEAQGIGQDDPAAAEAARLHSELAQFAAEKQQLLDETARLQGELAQIATEKSQLVAERESHAGEIDVLRQQLAAVEQQLVNWQQAETQWQCDREKWNAEREDWTREKDDFEQQIAECESRLAEQLRRIESLDEELAAARQSCRAPQNSVDWSRPQKDESDSVQPGHAATAELPAGESSGNPPAANDGPSPVTWDSQSLAAGTRTGSSMTPTPDELARFAEFSIWRQGAITPPPAEDVAAPSAQPANAEELPQAIEPAGEPFGQEVQAASFIERYAHMFADEPPEIDPAKPADAPRPAAPDVAVQKPRNVGTVPLVSNPTSSGEEEESIEQYMAKLLQRVRGDGNRVAASHAAPAISGSASSSTEPEAAIEHSDEPTAGTASTPWKIPNAPVDDEERVTTSLGTVRRKVPLAEQSADLEAFRALANESARRAISTHASRKHRRNAVTKAIVATLAGMTSLWLMLEAPHWQDLQFLTAWVSLMVAAYWAGQTYATLLETLRAAAYDGPEDGLKDLVEALRPRLPIDIER